MRKLIALTWKEFMQLKRDRITLRMIVMVPLLQTIIFGYAINYDVKHLKTLVFDESKSYESRQLVAKMTASEYFDVVGGIALILGVGTRVVAALLAVDMLAALLLVHLGNGFFVDAGGFEFVLTLLAASLFFALAGAGKLAVDAYLAKRK